MTPPSESTRELRISLPDWVEAYVRTGEPNRADEADRMRLAIALARENVLRDTGGPFGAAIFEAASGRLVAVGVNRVVPLRNSVLHAEIMAFMYAQARLDTYSLGAPGLPDHELYTSCEPCAMCLGASQWSGVRRVVWAATREDAGRLDFDEGPVFASSYKYLRRRGMTFTPGFLREEAVEVFALYRERLGEIYNG